MAKMKKITPDIELEAEEILAEMVGTISLPILLSGKALKADALKKWKVGALNAIQRQLIAGTKWSGPNGQRETVLSVALGMGIIANILAHRAKAVERRHIKAAFKAVKDSDMCAKDSGKDGLKVLGLWCDF